MTAAYQLEDGTPVFHPLGEVAIDADEDRVMCGLCGRWYRSLAPHLRAHDWTVADYRAAFGLNLQRALEAPGTTGRRSSALRRRIKTDPRLLDGMRIGQELARAGALNELARRADAARGRALERRRRTEDQGRRIGTARAASYRERRGRRARELGFADVDALLRQLYVVEGKAVADIAAELECAEITLIGEMERLGIARRPQAERLRHGRASLAAQRANTARAREARVHELGFDDLAAYLRARHHQQRWPYMLIAEELGVTVPVIRKLMKRSGVAGVRGVTVAKALR